MNLGSHMSIAGGVHKSIERGKSIGCTCIQIFTKNNNQWKGKPYKMEEIKQFNNLKVKHNIEPVIAHASYLINLASPEDKLFSKSIDSFHEELTRCDQLSIPYIVIHPGSHRGEGERNGIKRVSNAINLLYQKGSLLKAGILIETTSGQGSNIGYTFDQIAEIIDRVKRKDKVGVCFDTCHVFSAGYDLRTPKAYNETLKEFDKIVGLDKIKVIHLNDSKKGLGTRIDRHEHIGKGEIGLDGFRNIVNDGRFKETPSILETPKDYEDEWDKMNLKTLRRLVRNK